MPSGSLHSPIVPVGATAKVHLTGHFHGDRTSNVKAPPKSLKLRRKKSLTLYYILGQDYEGMIVVFDRQKLDGSFAAPGISPGEAPTVFLGAPSCTLAASSCTYLPTYSR
jgi:hypothetical protein